MAKSTELKPFKFDKEDIILVTTLGEECAITREPHGGISLHSRHGRTYHTGYENAFRQLRKNYLFDAKPQNLVDLLIAEQKAYLLIQEVAAKLMERDKANG